MKKIQKPTKGEMSIDVIQNIDNYLFYMKEYKDKLLSFDTKNFNYIIFEEDINNMVYDEFKEYYETDFIEILEFYNQYLDLDIDIIKDHWEENLTQNKTFLKNILKFISTSLPYTFLRESLKTLEYDGYHDCIDKLNNTNTKQKIIEQMEKQEQEQSNFFSLMKNVEENITNKSKKNQFTDILTILDSQIIEKKTVIGYFISIVQNSGEDQIKELFKLYIENDTENII